MQKITTQAELKKEIQLLKHSQAIKWPVLKEQFLEALNPATILKDAVKGMLSAPDLKTSAVNAAFGMATGLAATKLFMGKVHHPVTRLIAGAIMAIGTAGGTSKAVAGMKSIGFNLLKKIVKRKSPEEHNGKFL